MAGALRIRSPDPELRAPSAWRGHAPEQREPVNDNAAVPASALIAGRVFHFLLSLGATVLFIAAVAIPALVGRQ